MTVFIAADPVAIVVAVVRAHAVVSHHDGSVGC